MRAIGWIVISVIVVLAGYGWIALLGAPPVPVRLWPGAATVAVAAALLPLAGVVVAVLLAVVVIVANDLFYEFGRGGTTGQGLIFGPLVFVGAILTLVAVDRNAIEPLRGALLLILTTLTLLFSLYALHALRLGGGVGVRSQWGGLGGSMGGWQVLPATIFVLLALAFLAATIAVATTKEGAAAAGASPAAAAGQGAAPPGNARGAPPRPAG